MPQRISEAHAAFLRVSYERLPAARLRWRTTEGLKFLKALAAMCDKYGATQCAHAVGVSPQAIHYMLERRVPVAPAEVPPRAATLELELVFKEVLARRAAGKYARRTSREYARMHAALSKLLTEYELDAIAAVARIPVRELTRFNLPPLRETGERGDLAAVKEAYEQVRRGPDGEVLNLGEERRFLETVVDVATRVSRAKIAHELGVRPSDITQILRQEAQREVAREQSRASKGRPGRPRGVRGGAARRSDPRGSAGPD